MVQIEYMGENQFDMTKLDPKLGGTDLKYTIFIRKCSKYLELSWNH